MMKNRDEIDVAQTRLAVLNYVDSLESDDDGLGSLRDDDDDASEAYGRGRGERERETVSQVVASSSENPEEDQLVRRRLEVLNYVETMEKKDTEDENSENGKQDLILTNNPQKKLKKKKKANKTNSNTSADPKDPTKKKKKSKKKSINKAATTDENDQEAKQEEERLLRQESALNTMIGQLPNPNKTVKSKETTTKNKTKVSSTPQKKTSPEDRRSWKSSTKATGVNIGKILAKEQQNVDGATATAVNDELMNSEETVGKKKKKKSKKTKSSSASSSPASNPSSSSSPGSNGNREQQRSNNTANSKSTKGRSKKSKTTVDTSSVSRESLSSSTSSHRHRGGRESTKFDISSRESMALSSSHHQPRGRRESTKFRQQESTNPSLPSSSRHSQRRARTGRESTKFVSPSSPEMLQSSDDDDGSFYATPQTELRRGNAREIQIPGSVAVNGPNHIAARSSNNSINSNGRQQQNADGTTTTNDESLPIAFPAELVEENNETRVQSSYQQNNSNSNNNDDDDDDEPILVVASKMTSSKRALFDSSTKRIVCFSLIFGLITVLALAAGLGFGLAFGGSSNSRNADTTTNNDDINISPSTQNPTPVASTQNDQTSTPSDAPSNAPSKPFTTESPSQAGQPTLSPVTTAPPTSSPTTSEPTISPSNFPTPTTVCECWQYSQDFILYQGDGEEVGWTTSQQRIFEEVYEEAARHSYPYEYLENLHDRKQRRNVMTGNHQDQQFHSLLRGSSQSRGVDVDMDDSKSPASSSKGPHRRTEEVFQGVTINVQFVSQNFILPEIEENIEHSRVTYELDFCFDELNYEDRIDFLDYYHAKFESWMSIGENRQEYVREPLQAAFAEQDGSVSIGQAGDDITSAFRGASC